MHESQGDARAERERARDSARSSADAAPSSQSTGPPASGIDDALLQSVVWLTRHHGRTRHDEAN